MAGNKAAADTAQDTATADDAGGKVSGKLDNNQAKAFADRLEALESERATIGEDIKAVLTEAKAQGFDVKTLRAAVKARGLSEAGRKALYEQRDLFDAYYEAIT